MPYIDKKIYKSKSALKKYLEKISHLFEGKEIEAIYIDNINFFEFEEYEFDEKIDKKLFWDKNADEDVELKLKTSVTLKISDLYLNVDYTCPLFYGKYPKITNVSIYKNLKFDLLDISHYYSKNIIGHKIEKIFSTGYFDINIQLRNKYNFNINMWADDSAYIYECIPKKENNINYDKLYRYEKYSELEKYLNEIKNNFIGKKIENIMRLGIIFNDEDLDGKFIRLDEPIDIKAGENHLNICFNEESDAFCGINLFDYSETSYQDNLSWRSLNPIYKNNVIGQIIKDIILIKKDISDYEDKEYAKELEDNFIAIKILLENGCIFKIANWEDYMMIDECKKE